MKTRHENCSILCYRLAFTLVEVVASLMLLGTLLVGILAAHRRHSEQIRGARARMAAIVAADKLLSTWRDEGKWGATSASGIIEDGNDLVWRWTITTPPELQRLGAAVGRLELANTDSVEQAPLVAVEIFTDSVVQTPQSQIR